MDTLLAKALESNGSDPAEIDYFWDFSKIDSATAQLFLEAAAQGDLYFGDSPASIQALRDRMKVGRNGSAQ